MSVEINVSLGVALAAANNPVLLGQQPRYAERSLAASASAVGGSLVLDKHALSSFSTAIDEEANYAATATFTDWARFGVAVYNSAFSHSS
ncbi:MAG: hypothetical protein AUK47_24635 [Deltaproteobacteria bacterium CG2_30_63_29]|nr:MAG: hypothetical protein AUK47_24635 [Deltaproteobacteria bacterium CG2_30_63_29]PJB39904.1 MAG: hypothetical protein CO108_16100 [Deltaproteobacteria bacterium CG_4_9_14_3_um_filter_63_12]